MAFKQTAGADIPQMSDGQLLAYLLTMAGAEAPQAGTLSRALLESHQTLEAVLELPKKTLLDFPGLGEGAAAFLLLIPALTRRYIGPQSALRPDAPPLREAQDMSRLLIPFFRRHNTERVCAFFLGDDSQPLTSVLVAQGGESAVSCSVRRVLELTTAHRARGVVLAHNHPDGVLFFSKDDLLSTSRLLRALSVLNIPLLDHYLVAGERVISLRQCSGEQVDVGVEHPFPRDWFPRGKA